MGARNDPNLTVSSQEREDFDCLHYKDATRSKGHRYERSKDALGAPGLTTRKKKLLVTRMIAYTIYMAHGGRLAGSVSGKLEFLQSMKRQVGRLAKWMCGDRVGQDPQLAEQWPTNMGAWGESKRMMANIHSLSGLLEPPGAPTKTGHPLSTLDGR